MGNEWFLGTGKGREKAIKSGMSGETAVRAKMCLLGLVLELYFFFRNKTFTTGPPVCP